MNQWTKVVLAGAAVVAAVVLFVVLRPEDDEDEAQPTPAGDTTSAETTTEAETTTDEATTAETTTEEAPTTTAPPEPQVQRVLVVIRNGEPVGGVRTAEIEHNERVLLVVRSDVSDHVHLHGYDLIHDVAPGQPARIQFRANLRGRFEAELEDRGLPIVELEVR